MTNKEKYILNKSNEESFSVKKAKNRIKYRFRLRIYKKLWLYSSLFTDYLKDKIKYYENKGIDGK